MRAAFLGISLIAGGCAHDVTKVDVALGTGAYQPKDVRPYAARYLPYARLAQLAYADDVTPSQYPRRAGLCPKPPLDSGSAEGIAFADVTGRGWTCRYGNNDLTGEECPQGRVCDGGLGFQVWLRTVRGKCAEVVIAFRGTDGFGDVGDWISNLRWLAPRKYFDQYDEMKRRVADVVRDARAACPGAPIIAIGHSLGGGLAQFVAYASPSISYVYAFDPSPVTAYFMVDERTRDRAIRNHGVDRVYQAGEVLSLPRYLASGVFPTPTCLPPIQIVRFPSELRFNLIKRHEMAALANDMAARSNGYAGPLARRINPHACRILTRPDAV